MPLIRSDAPIQALLKRFALIYLPIVMVLSIVLLSSIRLDEQRLIKKIEGRENNDIKSANVLVTRDLSAVDTDLRVIANLPLMRRYLDSGNPAQREELEKTFLVLTREVRLYDQVRYLDASGQEVIRINYNDGKPAIVPREQLQNKLGRYYFDDTIKLKQGETFVSPLDLNIEHGSLEIPHKPMIRFGTPVFDSAGRKKGIILLNYFGNELLQHFHDAMPGDDSNDMLLNRDGYWLSGTKREDEWGFMLGKSERTFGHDFAEAWRAISATERGSLLTEQGLFSYTTVYPLLLGQHSSTGSALANARSQKEVMAHEYRWKIVSFVPHADLVGATFYNQASNRILLAFVYLLLALATWFVASATLSHKQAEKELHERKELEITNLRLSEEELLRSNAELEQFSYAISHDMRQPLRMISSYLQLLEMGLADQLDSEKRGHFDIAIDGAKRIDQMLVELLEYSRAGRMGEPPTWIESRAALDDALQFLQPAIAEAQAKLEITGDWPRIFASHDEILRLLQNLIGNAAKFRVAGRTPEITVSSEVSRNEWHLCVTDNGVGIIPGQIKQLFKVFQRLQTRAAYEGTGIGLALCRKIAEHHKGRIWAESAGEGRGSKFCIVLPVPEEKK